MAEYIPGIHFPTSGTPEERIKEFLSAYKPTDTGFDIEILSNMRVVSATAQPKASVTFELTVVPSLCNKRGPLHGGATATIFDMCTTMAPAPIARPDFWQFGGVSRNISVSYFRPALLHDVLTVYCEVVQIGRTLSQFPACSPGAFWGLCEPYGAQLTSLNSYDTRGDETKERRCASGYGGSYESYFECTLRGEGAAINVMKAMRAVLGIDTPLDLRFRSRINLNESL